MSSAVQKQWLRDGKHVFTFGGSGGETLRPRGTSVHWNDWVLDRSKPQQQQQQQEQQQQQTEVDYSNTIHFAYFRTYGPPSAAKKPPTSEAELSATSGGGGHLVRLSVVAYSTFRGSAEDNNGNVFGVRVGVATYHDSMYNDKRRRRLLPAECKTSLRGGRGCAIPGKMALRRTALGRFWRCPAMLYSGNLPSGGGGGGADNVPLLHLTAAQLEQDFLRPLVAENPGLKGPRVSRLPSYCTAVEAVAIAKGTPHPPHSDCMPCFRQYIQLCMCDCCAGRLPAGFLDDSPPPSQETKPPCCRAKGKQRDDAAYEAACAARAEVAAAAKAELDDVEPHNSLRVTVW